MREVTDSGDENPELSAQTGHFAELSSVDEAQDSTLPAQTRMPYSSKPAQDYPPISEHGSCNSVCFLDTPAIRRCSEGSSSAGDLLVAPLAGGLSWWWWRHSFMPDGIGAEALWPRLTAMRPGLILHGSGHPADPRRTERKRRKTSEQEEKAKVQTDAFGFSISHVSGRSER